eukprot:SAG31_NODE_6464_length_2007_cov_1.645702_3_plen_111_part_00
MKRMPPTFSAQWLGLRPTSAWYMVQTDNRSSRRNDGRNYADYRRPRRPSSLLSKSERLIVKRRTSIDAAGIIHVDRSCLPLEAVPRVAPNVEKCHWYHIEMRQDMMRDIY